MGRAEAVGPRGGHGNEPRSTDGAPFGLWQWGGKKRLAGHLERRPTGLGGYLVAGMREKRSPRRTSWPLDRSISLGICALSVQHRAWSTSDRRGHVSANQLPQLPGEALR